MENVFAYFVAIGAGISLGLTIGAIPAVLVWRFVRRREAGSYGVKKVHTRA